MAGKNTNKGQFAGPILAMLFSFAAVAIAIKFSLVVAVVFCTSTGAWVLLGMWFSGSHDANLEEEEEFDYSNRGPVHHLGQQGEEDGGQPRVLARIQMSRARNRTVTPPANPAPEENKESPEATLLPTSAVQRDLRESLAEAIAEIEQLLSVFQARLARYDGVMAKRLHKNTGHEHRAIITARKILAELEKRLDLLKSAMEDFENGREEKDKIFSLIDADLIVAQDSLNALPGEQPLPPVPRVAWQSTLEVLCKQIARRPSFLHLAKFQPEA